MRRLIPPSPVRLTSEAVLEYTTTLLQKYLTFLAHAGHQWQTSDVWHILLAAAARILKMLSRIPSPTIQ